MDKINHYFRIAIYRIKNIKLTTPVAILLGAIIIAFSIVSYGFIMRTDTSTIESTMFKGKIINESDYIEGNTKNNIFVVEYSDPECPFCVKFHSTMKQLRNEYGDRVAFVYRHFPLDIHPNAFDESRAIACAGTIGGAKALYEYIDTLYGYKFSKQDPVSYSFPPL